MLGEGAQRVRERCWSVPRRRRHDMAPGQHELLLHPPPAESKPGAVNRCTHKHTTFYSSTSREEIGGAASPDKASTQGTISFSSNPAFPARDRRRSLELLTAERTGEPGFEPKHLGVGGF